MIHAETIKYFEDGKMVAEFDDLQVYSDFICDRRQRKVEAEFILQRRGRERRIVFSWLCLGFIVGLWASIIIKLLQ